MHTQLKESRHKCKNVKNIQKPKYRLSVKFYINELRLKNAESILNNKDSSDDSLERIKISYKNRNPLKKSLSNFRSYE